MLTLGQLVKAVHDLHVKVALARRRIRISDPLEAWEIAATTLEEVEQELERIKD